MKLLTTILLASLAALAVQPVVLSLWVVLPLILAGGDMTWSALGPIFLASILFAAPFVLLLGVPLSLILWHAGRLRWWPLAVAGGVAGALFVGWNIPGGDSGYSSGGNWYGTYVDFVVAGKPTLHGWLSYLQSVLAFALHGVVGASAYYAVWLLRRGNSIRPKLRHST